MRAILTRLTKQIGWNRRIFTERDLLDVCRAQGVPVVDAVLPEKGIYTRLQDGRLLIGLDRNLKGFDRRRVLAHEVGHMLLHTPGQWYSWLCNEQKLHWQAEVFAACALLPQRLLYSPDAAEIQHILTLPRELVRLRVEVWRRMNL
ncbi:MAG TPA: ImmA/IrrE family metallo-endopeptidase [Blastocatellia bacterium]|nr:ImmA/IrrE family metallo-endopeptidase [Blastocatellia bacterium]